MYKACSRCGKIHSYNYKCNKGKVYKHNEIDKLRNTKRWARKSVEIREASKYLCSVCLDEGLYNYKDVEIHHIIKLQDEPERLLDNYNLICLCKYHHKLADNNKLDKDYLFKLAKEREENA